MATVDATSRPSHPSAAYPRPRQRLQSPRVPALELRADGGDRATEPPIPAPVHVVTGTFLPDGRRWVTGEIELVAGTLARRACNDLVETYHPRLDVFSVTGREAPTRRGDGHRVILRVQCEVGDVHRAVELLVSRLRSELGLAVETS